MIINGLKINYRIIGEGRPFLILHGWGSCSDRWQRVGEMLAENGIKVIIPDLPGFGKSLAPKSAWGLDEYSNFVEEFVNQLGLNKFYLLGHSFGGSLAVKFSLQNPERGAKLILVSPACVRKKSLKNQALKFISKFLKVKPLFIRKLFYRKSDYLSTKGTMRDTYLKVIAEDLSGILSQVQVPTIIIWGDKDDITPLKDAYLIAEKIKNAKLEIVPNVSHNLHLEAPRKLIDVILNEVKDPVDNPRDSSPMAQNDNAL